MNDDDLLSKLKLDRRRDFGTVHGDHFDAVYEQDGIPFTASGEVCEAALTPDMRKQALKVIRDRAARAKAKAASDAILAEAGLKTSGRDKGENSGEPETDEEKPRTVGKVPPPRHMEEENSLDGPSDERIAADKASQKRQKQIAIAYLTDPDSEVSWQDARKAMQDGYGFAVSSKEQMREIAIAEKLVPADQIVI